MTSVWQETERVLGQQLDIELDKASMRAAIDHL